MAKHCFSCAFPLGEPGDPECEGRGPHADFCKWCVDSHGNLHSREVVQQAVAVWFQGWQPDLDPANALARAEHYMKAMPAWAE